MIRENNFNQKNALNIFYMFFIKMESPERSHRIGREEGDGHMGAIDHMGAFGWVPSDGCHRMGAIREALAEEHKLIGFTLACLCDFLPKVPQPCPTVPIHGIRWMVANGWYCSLDPTAGRLSP